MPPLTCYSDAQMRIKENRTTWTSPCYHQNFSYTLLPSQAKSGSNWRKVYACVETTFATHTKTKAQIHPHTAKIHHGPQSQTLVCSKPIRNSPSKPLKREILYHNHGKLRTRHLGRDQTIWRVTALYWWPGLKEWVANYVKGCAPCQQNKILTHKQKTPLFHIPAHPTAFPFQVVAMDLITQLPESDGSNAILTIVDQGCIRAAVFLPCSTTITSEGVAKLYLENIYRWFGLLTKIILD